jgi:HsdM N-terminal domain
MRNTPALKISDRARETLCPLRTRSGLEQPRAAGVKSAMPDHNYFANLIWQIADLLRGPFRPPRYERVTLPMTVLRRFDCVLAASKSKVLAEYARIKGSKIEGNALDQRLNKAAGAALLGR